MVPRNQYRVLFRWAIVRSQNQNPVLWCIKHRGIHVIFGSMVGLVVYVVRYYYYYYCKQCGTKKLTFQEQKHCTYNIILYVDDIYPGIYIYYTKYIYE